jgi:hypothetical protein
MPFGGSARGEARDLEAGLLRAEVALTVAYEVE